MHYTHITLDLNKQNTYSLSQSRRNFSTYTLSYNYPKITDQSIAYDGHNNDLSLCSGFDDNGDTRGISVAFQNNVDYFNAFVGHYEAGDIQYNGHQSYDNNNLIYWKETKVSFLSSAITVSQTREGCC
jgi:hypothetical protein